MVSSSDPANGTLSPRAYHKGNVAQDLRKAAERILNTEGLENVTIRRLTREVGVVPANFYNHFESLDDLLSRIVATILREATDRALDTWSQPGAKSDLLLAAANDFICFCLRNQGIMHLMLRRREPGKDNELEAASMRSFGEIIRFIYDDDAKPPSVSAAAGQYGIAFGYVALCYGFAYALAEGRFGIDTADEAELSLLIRNGILPFLDGSAAAVLSVGKDGRAAGKSRKRSPASGK